MTALLKRLSASMRSRKTQLALAVRVTVAAFGALAIALALNLMLPLWAVLTSLIVTQMSVGQSLKATRDYMFGTVGGAIYGGALAVLIPHSGEAGLLALLVLAVAPLAFIAAINPSLNPRSIAFSRSWSARSPGLRCLSSCCRRGRMVRSASALRGCSN